MLSFPLTNKASEATRQWRQRNLDRAKANDRVCYQRRQKELSARYSEVQQAQRRTFLGKIVLTFRGMQARVRGQSSPQYAGLTLLPRAAFESWAVSDPAYKGLFAAWEASGFVKALSPSIDRIDHKRGYTLDNIQWITSTENSRKAKIQDPLERDPLTGRYKPR